MGRDTKYDAKFHPVLAKYMARCGLTDKEIARELNISKATLNRWKKTYPEFCDSLKENKKFVDALVEDSLLKKAIGYEKEEVEITASNDKKSTRIKKTRKWYHDTTAAIFWLKNREPGRWSDVQDLNHHGAINTSKNIDLSYMSDEELQKEVAKYRDNNKKDKNKDK